jgi:hypothetical protein
MRMGRDVGGHHVIPGRVQARTFSPRPCCVLAAVLLTNYNYANRVHGSIGGPVDVTNHVRSNDLDVTVHGGDITLDGTTQRNRVRGYGLSAHVTDNGTGSSAPHVFDWMGDDFTTGGYQQNMLAAGRQRTQYTC